VTKKIFAPGLIVLLSAICLTSITSAQTSWWRTYGGTNEDWGNSVQQTTDGGYIIAGWTMSFGAGNEDVYLIKTNASGDTLWARTCGGTDDEWGTSVRQTADGGYIIAGSTRSFGAGGINVYLVRTDAQGDTLWTRTYGGTNDDEGYSVQQTTDSGYVVAGYTCTFGAGKGSVYLVKTNASGDTLWTKTYGGADDDVGYSVQQTIDGGYVIVGYTLSFGAGSGHVYLVTTDASGDTLWTKTYGGTGIDEGHSVQQTSDSGYIIAGSTRSFGQGTPTNRNVYLIRTNSSGDTLWTRVYGGLYDEQVETVRQTTDGAYIVAGCTNSFGAGFYDAYLIRTNAQGDTLWTRTYGGTDNDWGYSVQQTPDEGYIIAGYSASFGAGNYDVYLIKCDANGYVGMEEPMVRHPANPTRFLVRPNPFTSFARVPGHETELFALSDVTGRQVAICNGDRVGEGLRPGVYFLALVGTRAGRAATAPVIKVAF
jgi:hypothetical protein